MLLFVAALALTFPVVEQVRIASLQPNASRGAAVLVLTGVRETVRHPGASTGSALDTLNRRTRQIENVAAVLRDTPSVFPYTKGGGLPKAFAIALVPRVLWPNKPVFDVGRTFPQLYLKQSTTSRSTTGPSHFGDLYRNFGLSGLVFGMALLGAVFAVLGRLTERGGVRTLLIIAFAFTALVRPEDSLAEGVVAFTHLMAPVIVGALLLPRYRSAGSLVGN
jgi:hypothetical protein